MIPKKSPVLQQAYQTLPVSSWEQGSTHKSKLDKIAEECAIALVYNGISHVVMMATPLNLEEFALGFSLSEGIIDKASEVFEIEVVEREKGFEVDIKISSARMMALKVQRRNLTGRTGCGLCGTESLEQAIRPIKNVSPQPLPSAKAIQRAVSQLNQHQPLQALTGTAHGAAWCDIDGEIMLVREDVGRHNALDKLIGALQYSQLSVNSGFVLISSRASYEMVHKACSYNFATLVAVSAPTALAIELANQAQLNLVGFARDGRHVIYTQQESAL